VYYFVSRYTPFQLKSGQNIIKVIDIKYISKGKGLILVKIKNSMILLGFDEKNLTKIKEWEDEEIPASDS
jgi:flagellar biogenesis protein FliO